MPAKAVVYEKSHYTELNIKTNLSKIIWENFYSQNTTEKLFISNFLTIVDVGVEVKWGGGGPLPYVLR